MMCSTQTNPVELTPSPLLCPFVVVTSPWRGQSSRWHFGADQGTEWGISQNTASFVAMLLLMYGKGAGCCSSPPAGTDLPMAKPTFLGEIQAAFLHPSLPFSAKTIQHLIFHRARVHSILSRTGFSCHLLLLMGSETTPYSASWQCLQTPAGPALCPCFLEILFSSTSQLSCIKMGWQPSQEGDRSFSHHALGH